MKFRITDNWDFIISDDQGEREEILTQQNFIGCIQKFMIH